MSIVRNGSIPWNHFNGNFKIWHTQQTQRCQRYAETRYVWLSIENGVHERQLATLVLHRAQ